MRMVQVWANLCVCHAGGMKCVGVCLHVCGASMSTFCVVCNVYTCVCVVCVCVRTILVVASSS